MKKPSNKHNIERMFLLVQVVLYTIFLTLDLTGLDAGRSNQVKYIVIILCFCYAFFAGKGTVRFLKAALLFTVLADLFLLIMDYYFYGVLVFIIVQHLYGVRLVILKSRQSVLSEDGDLRDHTYYYIRKHVLSGYIIRVILQAAAASVICIMLSILDVSLELLSVVSIYYFILISSNVISSIRLAFLSPRDKGNVLYGIGMLLFLLCDINVGLYNLSGFIAMPENAYHLIYAVSSLLMWTFYAPAQVLIAISSRYSK